MRRRARAAAERVSGLRYLVEDGLYLLRSAADGVRRSVSARWAALELYTRRRIAAAAAVLAAAAVIWLLIIPVAPCQFPGGDACPPADDAVKLVPAGASAYLHVNLDPQTEQGERLREFSASMPALSAQVAGFTSAVPGLGLNLGDWFEGEVATLLLPPGPDSEASRTAVMFETGEPGAARRFGRELIGTGGRRSEHEGVEVETGAEGSMAIAGGFLIVGDRTTVERMIDAGAGKAPALSDHEAAEQVRDELPAARVADAYVSGSGAQRLLRPGQPLALLEPFVNPRAARAAAASVTLTESGVELALSSSQESARAERSPGFFAAFEAFSPQLPERLASGTFAYLGLGRPAEGAERLVGEATTDAPEIAATIDSLTRDLERRGGISFADQVLPLLGEEASLSVGPPSGQGIGAVPYLELLTRGIDEEQATKDMARLQGALADIAGADRGAAFEELNGGDALARSLDVSPNLELTYAIFDDLLLLATQPEALDAAEDEDDSLAESELFRETTSDLGGSPLALLFADLEGLVRLGEQAGLAEDPAYAVFANDLRQLRSLGTVVSRDGSLLNTRMRMLID